MKNKPNIIYIMADDLGYGDVGFNGNTKIKTPCLDKLCSEGAKFTRFYAGGPVCSPTRGTCLTGRHYMRYGVTHANTGRLPKQEITVEEIAKKNGYRTGHFGKWHLGTLSVTQKDGNRGGSALKDVHSPPWIHNFDVCFSTESKVPTWDPMITPKMSFEDFGKSHKQAFELYSKNQKSGEPFGSHYWDEKEKKIEDNLFGDDSRIIVDRVVPFIEGAVKKEEPFMAVVWFHAPHSPVVAGDKYRKLYPEYSNQEQHYYGCVTAMDEQVGRLNELLKKLDIDNNTIVWFCSDNGPEGSEILENNGRMRGVTKGLRGRKRSLFNGGICVPGIVKWPKYISPGQVYTMPCSTLDYLPTLVDILDYDMKDRSLDGESLVPLFKGKVHERSRPIPYRFVDTKKQMFGSPTFAVIDNRYKYLTNITGDRSEDRVYDLVKDPYEKSNIIDSKQDFADRMMKYLLRLMSDFKKSHEGEDYQDIKYKPVNDFQDIWQGWIEE